MSEEFKAAVENHKNENNDRGSLNTDRDSLIASVEEDPNCNGKHSDEGSDGDDEIDKLDDEEVSILH
jgi:hypothetical protein